jgi:HK97 family phage major capsid protein
MADLKELNDTLKSVSADLERVSGELKTKAEAALKEAGDAGKLAESTKAEVDQLLTDFNAKTQLVEALTARIDEIEQKSVRGGGQDEPRKSLGEMFVENDEVKAWLDSSPSKGKADMRVTAELNSATTNADGSVGDAINQTRLPGILPLAQRRLTVRDLLTPGRMDGNTLEYVKETGFTNAAAPVAESAAKPESTLKLDLVSTSAKVIAHFFKASRQVLDDVSQLKSMIDQRLMYGLAYVEETELLSGDGTGQHLLGIIPQATAYSAPVALADLNIIDVIRLAMLQAALAEYPSSGIVLHPTDWAGIETLKDSQGRYIIGNPQGTTQPTLWSLPVVATQAITVRKFLTGAFKLGAQVFDRWDARVETGYVNDDFTKNLVTILGEERLALAVYRPEAFIYGDFDTALAA